ncbi:MAG: regulatory protein RecX [Candidatus Omnitrophica bacterium]|nr:regulatory protein RecX [Candidatus Omnitrophota bacterium]
MSPSTIKSLQEGKTAVFRLLQYRPRTEYELRVKLKEKQFEIEVVDQVIEYFKKIGLVNDRDFAKAWVTSRLNKPFGAVRIKRELYEKGIDKETVGSVLQALSGEYDELPVIRSLVERKLAHSSRISPEKIKPRIYNFLLRRGFSYSAIKKVIDNL